MLVQEPGRGKVKGRVDPRHPQGQGPESKGTGLQAFLEGPYAFPSSLSCHLDWSCNKSEFSSQGETQDSYPGQLVARLLLSHESSPRKPPPPSPHLLRSWLKLWWIYETTQASWVTQVVKHLPTVRETWVQSLGQEDLLEKGMATHSSILAWRIPWTEEPDGLQSLGSQRVGHDWATNTFTFLSMDHYKQTWSLLSIKDKCIIILFWLGLLFIIFIFWPHHAVCRILVPWPRIEPGPRQWKYQLLTTGLPGNSGLGLLYP